MQVAVPGVFGRQAPNLICLHMYNIFDYSPFLMPTKSEPQFTVKHRLYALW